MASGVDNNMSFFVPIIIIFCAVRGLLLIFAREASWVSCRQEQLKLRYVKAKDGIGPSLATSLLKQGGEGGVI